MRGFRDEDEGGRSDLVDIPVTVITQTEKAWKVGLQQGSVGGQRGVGGADGNGVWVPKSLCEVEKNGLNATITLSRRLAQEKGLVG
jgi:hypothetical protein